ncbi:uncharacterized protein LOC113501712 [Trichoplusia ni]|uniref:Uncharacterized protein LOC113501712 n=1 Tax=Trichoplusia ni TaxID=7111 RepID=A0A7E5WE41_TRINI|nr:uncharacterized protein LOC113501712 [Trichoplusia ni]
MASTLFLIVLSTLFCAVLSLPVDKLSKTYDSNSDTEIVLSSPTDNNPGLSLNSAVYFDAVAAPSLEDSVKDIKRTKRQVVNAGNNRCPSDKIQFRMLCMSKERYEEIKKAEMEA